MTYNVLVFIYRNKKLLTRLDQFFEKIARTLRRALYMEAIDVRSAMAIFDKLNDMKLSLTENLWRLMLRKHYNIIICIKKVNYIYCIVIITLNVNWESLKCLLFR